MSYTEYYDLFVNAQQNKDAKYKCFVFDLVGSKTMDKNQRYDAQVKSIHTLNALAKDLKFLETKLGKKILVDENPVRYAVNIASPKDKLFAFLSNPAIVNGDCFVLYCHNGIKTEDIKKLFLKECKKVGNQFAYNFVEGNFETLDVNEKDKKYWVGYVAQQLSNIKQEKIQFKNEEMTM